MLPDVALLEIFACYVNQVREEEKEDSLKIQACIWHMTVIVFEVPLGGEHQAYLG
jgi:hypothetical protein